VDGILHFVQDDCRGFAVCGIPAFGGQALTPVYRQAGLTLRNDVSICHPEGEA